jgi:hypothetical protein
MSSPPKVRSQGRRSRPPKIRNFGLDKRWAFTQVLYASRYSTSFRLYVPAVHAFQYMILKLLMRYLCAIKHKIPTLSIPTPFLDKIINFDLALLKSKKALTFPVAILVSKSRFR